MPRGSDSPTDGRDSIAEFSVSGKECARVRKREREREREQKLRLLCHQSSGRDLDETGMTQGTRAVPVMIQNADLA